MKLDSKRRETLSKLLCNLAVFWLTALPVSILTNFGLEQDAIIPLVAVAVMGVSFAAMGVLISKDEKAKDETLRYEGRNASLRKRKTKYRKEIRK